MVGTKLNINVKGFVAIPLTSTIRGKRGDYLLINNDDAVTVIDGKTYHALMKFSEAQVKQPRLEGPNVVRQHAMKGRPDTNIDGRYQRKRMRKDYLLAREQDILRILEMREQGSLPGLLTSELGQHVNDAAVATVSGESVWPDVTGKNHLSRITNSCRYLLEEKKITVKEVVARDASGKHRPQLMWSLSDASIGKLTDPNAKKIG